MNKKIKDLSFSEMMEMQRTLHAMHEGEWEPLEKEYGIHSMLWMVEEMGEAIAVIKKKRHDAIVNESAVREAFLEEMSDVLMYFTDTLLRYQVTPEEIGKAYVKKHLKNKGRHYLEEYSHLFEGED